MAQKPLRGEPPNAERGAITLKSGPGPKKPFCDFALDIRDYLVGAGRIDIR